MTQRTKMATLVTVDTASCKPQNVRLGKKLSNFLSRVPLGTYSFT